MTPSLAIASHLDEFHGAMIKHIQSYTIGQYKDWPEDEATYYTVEDCLWQMRRYLRRHGQNRRPGQDRMDMLKLAHYAAMSASKTYDTDLDMGGYDEELSYRAREWCVIFSWVKQAVINDEMPYAREIPELHRSSAEIVYMIEQTIRRIHKTSEGATIPRLLRIIYFAALAWLKMPEQRPEKEVPFVRVKAMHPDARLPEVKTSGSVGADLSAVEACTVSPGQVALVRTGIAMQIPKGYEGQVRSRSGISTAKQLILLNGIGTIDSDYRGEIMVPVKNIGRERQDIFPGDRVAQIMIRPAPGFELCWADELDETERGVGGFGSTGVN